MPNPNSFEMTETSALFLSKFFTLPTPVLALGFAVVFSAVNASAGDVVQFPGFAKSKCEISVEGSGAGAAEVVSLGVPFKPKPSAAMNLLEDAQRKLKERGRQESRDLLEATDLRFAQGLSLDFYNADAPTALLSSFKTRDTMKDQFQNRNYSPLATDPGFGLFEAFKVPVRPVRWLNSGLSKSLVTMTTDPIGGGILDRVGEFVIASERSAQQFEEISTGSENGVFLHPQHIQWNAGSLGRPDGPADQSFDVITDVAGDATKMVDLGQVLLNYQELLTPGGTLLLRLPLREIDDSFALNRFSDAHGAAISPDRFFSRLPGFELVNSFELTQRYYFGAPGMLGLGAMPHPYGNQIRFITVVLRKTGARELNPRSIRARIIHDDRGRQTRVLTLSHLESI